MKKSYFIWGAAILLVIIAVIVTANRKMSNPSSKLPAAGASSMSSDAGSAVSSDDSSPDNPLIAAADRQKAPNITLNDINGKSINLSDYKGKNVYVNFWATWCPWCVQELPDIDKINQEYKDKNLVIFAVDIGEDKGTVSKFIKGKNFSFNVLLDTDEAVSDRYNINSIPVSLFIDKNGNIAQQQVGAMTESDMKSIIDQLLSEN